MRGFRRRRLSGRRQSWLFVIGLIAAVAVVAGLPYALAGDDARDPGYVEYETALDLPPTAALATAAVLDVVDGDTIDVELDGRRVRVRYFGVDTPERGEGCYREAVTRNEELLGETVLLLPDDRERDSFGRLLRYVFTAERISIDATLVAEGFGRAWREDGAFRDQIVALEETAEGEGRGCLWR